MILIDADTAPLTPLALVAALRAGHAADDTGEVGRLLLGHVGDAALTWAGWREDLGLAVKTATVFPGNAPSHPTIQSLVSLFDGRNGTPLAVIRGDGFTRMKTAADSALAADILARPDVHTLAVLGAGAQAETHIAFHRALRPSIRRVLVWNRTPAAAETLAARLASPDVAVAAVASAEAAVRGACVVACLTAATVVPVLHGDWLAPGTHVDLVGSYTPAMRESDDAVVLRGRLFADSLRFGVTTCGDYAQPLTTGLITPDRIEGDLFGLCSGRIDGRRHAAEITVCKNGGGGHLDLMAARAFYDSAVLDRMKQP